MQPHTPTDATTSGRFHTAIPARYADQRARVLSILKRWESTPAWVIQRPGRELGRSGPAAGR